MRMAIFLVAATLLVGCSTRPKLVLLEDADYKFTRPGEAVAGIEMREQGIWFRRGAVMKLQNKGFLPWED